MKRIHEKNPASSEYSDRVKSRKDCTRRVHKMHKRIRGRMLTDRYALVWKCFVRIIKLI